MILENAVESRHLPPTLDGMTEVITPESPMTDAEAARVELRAPEGWRVVWLPRHGVFLGFRDVDMPAGIARPAVYAATAKATLTAIRGHQQLTDTVREWVQLHEGAAA